MPAQNSPEIEMLRRRLEGIDMEEAAFKATKADAVIDTHVIDGCTVGITKKGYVYTMDPASRDWVANKFPPVPGTRARKFYDERQRIEDKIRQLQTTGEVIDDDIRDLIDPIVIDDDE